MSYRSLSLKILVTSILAIAGFFFGLERAQAANNNVFGFAWSDTAGWISMNCDQSQHGGSNDCTSSSYGVHLDQNTGAMSGFGWSDRMGWVKFNVGTATPTYVGTAGGSAKVTNIAVSGSHAVAGWIRFCSSFNAASIPDNCGSTANTANTTNGGWNGWVAMTNDGSGGGVAYGVTFNTVTSAFRGFAWGGTLNLPGSETIGWISFDKVVAVLTPPPAGYIPIIKISALTPTPAGGSTKISYIWANPTTNPLDKPVNCTAFTVNPQIQANGGVSGWDSTTFPTVAALPDQNLQQTGPIWVYAPVTTYYLDCRNGAGVHAADPNTPTISCVMGTPSTCPKTQTTVSTQTDIVLKVRNSNTPGGAYQLMAPGTTFYVNQGDKVDLEWSAPRAWDACTAVSTTGNPIQSSSVFTGPVSGIPFPAASYSYSTTVANLNNAGTTYQIASCSDAGGGLSGESNAVHVEIVPKDKMIMLKVRNHATGGAYFDTATNGGVLLVDPGDTIDLEWKSIRTWTSCTGESNPSISAWDGQSVGGISGTLVNSQLDIPTSAVPGTIINYRISACDSGATDVSAPSNTEVIQVKAPTVPGVSLEAKLDGDPDTSYADTVLVPVGAGNITLRWQATGGATLTGCTAMSSSPGSALGQYWSGNVADPTAIAPGTDLERATVSNITTRYYIACQDTASGTTVNDDAYAISFPPVGSGFDYWIDNSPSCIKDPDVLFDLGWHVNQGDGGYCSLANDGGVPEWDNPSYPLNSNNEDHLGTGMNISGDTDFTLECFDIDGATLGVRSHTVVIDPTCTDAPRHSWFFRFFER